MAYTERREVNETGVRPSTIPGGAVVEYHDTVRWGPIFAGIVVAVVSQLMLSALGTAIGAIAVGEATAGTIGTGLGIWAILSLLVSLFLGGWMMASSCGPMNSKTAMMNATIMWATTIVLSAWLLTTGITGTFGVLASSAGGAAGEVLNQVQQPGGASIPSKDQVAQAVPNITPAEADQYGATASKAGFTFLIGSLLGLACALVGATVGAKKPRAIVR